jgi:hypothetical protein
MTIAPPQQHPVLACVRGIEALLDQVSSLDPAYMRTTEKESALRGLARLSARLDSLRLRVVAAAGDVAADDGARDVAAWLGAEVNADRGVARRELRLAHALDIRWSQVREALARGDLSVAQAEMIVQALEALPGEVGLEVRDLAEKHLVAQAADFGPRELRILGRRVLDVVAPEVGEEHERRLLEAEERRARRRVRVTARRNGDGTTAVNSVLPDPVADRLLAYLHAYTAPRRHGAGVFGDPSADAAAQEGAAHAGADAGAVATRDDDEGKGPWAHLPYPVQLGHAMCALLEHLDPSRLPIHGGDATTVVVTIDLETLRSGLGTATLPDGSPVTAGEARRMACTAGIIPAVLGGASQPLDLGRSRRLFSAAQRTALGQRDRHCRAVGCDIPARWCEAHHRRPWSEGGRTDLVDGELLCVHHHHRIHDPAYHHDRLPDGSVRFHRRR